MLSNPGDSPALPSPFSLNDMSEQRWQALAQATGQIVWVAEPDGRGKEVAAWCAFTGQTIPEALGMGWLAAMHPADLPEAAEAWRAAIEHKTPYVIENRVRRHDGVYRTLQHRGVPMVDATGAAREWVGVSIDVTDMRRLERERLQIISIVSHELKTPLTGLKTRTQLLRRRLKRGQEVDDESLEQLEQGIDKMTRLVNDLVEAGRFESGNLALNPQPCDLTAICERVVEEQRLATGRAVALDAEPGLSVLADPVRAEQVLQNLLANALRYSPPETAVRVVAHRHGEMAHVSIIDHGPGIPPEAQARLFERFYRVKGIRSYGGSNVGLGVGLYVCQQLVQMQGGEIGVASVEGEGSTFWFTLPLAA